MANNDFVIKLLAMLDKSASKKEINSNIKDLEKSVRILSLTATLAKGATKQELNQTIKLLEGQLNHIKLQAKIERKNLKSDVDKALQSVSFKDIDVNVDSGKTKLKLQKIIADAKNTVQSNPISLNIDLKKEKLKNQLTTYITKNSKITESKALLNEVEQLQNKIKNINDRASLRNATDSFQLFRSECAATGFQAKSTADKVKGLIGNVTKISSAFGVVTLAVSKFQEGLQTIKRNDSILTEVSKTSNATKRELEELGNSAFDTASKFGQFSSDYLTAIQEMNRSGFYGEAGKALGELSLKAQAAGDISAEVSQKYLLATSAAYGYKGSVEKLTAVLDGQNAITNHFSTDMDTMATATEKAGSVAANAGVKVEELSAMIGTISARTKEAGEITGTGIKSLLVDLQNVASSKIVDTLDKANASMTETVNGTKKLRNPIDILKDLAKTYNSLDESDPLKSEITTNIGKKYHANQLSALLAGWEDYEKMLKTYSEGMGSAEIEAQKTADSVEGRLHALQNSWDELVNSLTDKGAIKGGVSFLDNILQSATKLIDTFGEIPLALASVTAGMTTLKNDYGITKVFDVDNKKLDIEGNLFGIDFTQIKHFRAAEKAIDSWNQKIASGVTDINSFNDATVKNTAQLREYLQTCSVDAPASLKGYKQSLQAAGEATNSLRLGTVLLNAAISFGIGVAIEAGFKLINNWIHSAENAKEATEGFIESYGSLQSEFKSNTTNILELQKQYTKLSEGVDSLGKNVSLTNDEYNSYKDIISQLSDIMPDLAVRYNEQGEKIGFVQGKLKDLNAEYDKYKQRQAIKMITDGDEDGNKIKDTIKNYRNQADPLTGVSNRDKIESLQFDIDHAGIGFNKNLSNEEIEKKKSEIQQYQAEIDNAVAAIQDSLSLLAQSNNEYYKLTDEQQNYVDTFLGNITDEFIQQNGLDTEDGMRVFVNSIIDGLNKNKNGVADAYRELFSFDFETTEMTPEEINEKVDKMVQNIADILNIKDVRQLKISLGFQFVEDNANQYDNTLNKFKAFDPVTLAKDPNHNSKIDAFANNNNVTQEELEALAEKGYDATTSINVLENALKSLRAITDSANKQSIEDKWASLSNTDDEELKNTQSDLLELAKAGKLTEAAFHSTTGADTFLNTINESLPEAINWINELVTSSDQLSNLQSNISSIQSAFSDFQENGSVSAETLAGMSDELKQLDGWKDFAETLGDSTSSVQQCRQAMNDLATEYVNSNNFLSQLNDSNKDYYISTLSNMDVENAEEIVMTTLKTKTEALAAEKKWCAEKGRELSTATDGEVSRFIQEHGYSEATATSLYKLALQKKLVNGTTLDFSKDLTAISNYVNEITGASNALSTLARSKGTIPGAPSNVQNLYQKKSQKEVDDALKSNVKIKIDPPSSKNSSGSGSKGNKSSQKSKQEIDWIARKLEQLQKKIDLTKAKFENLFSVKAKSSNLDKQIRQTTKLMNAESKAADKYKKKAENYAKNSGLSKSLQKAVQEGRLDKYKLKDLIKKYGEKTENKIQEYQKWYDNYQDAQKKAIELTTEKWNLKEQKYQLYVDDANAKKDKSNARMELDSGNYKEQNKHLNTQKKYIEESYKYQIKIADLNEDSIKVSQLKAEKEKELRDIEKQKFDNIDNQFKNELSVTQAKQDAISREIDLIQARGDMLDQSKYKSQIAIENEKIASYEQEKQLLEQQLNNITEGSDEWYEALGVIEDVKANIDNSKQSISEMEKSINEIGETLRTKILDSFERIKTESDWLVGMMDKIEDFDDQTHTATNEGIARLASYITGSNISKQQADFAQQWLDELTANKDSNGEAHFKSALTGTDINYTADEYAEARKNAYDQIRDLDSQYADYKNKAIEWEISKLKAELSIMQEIIDAKKDALQSEKDLHNYQKSIQQSTKNIGLLQKQIAAVQGDTSEEGIARIQRLQKELTDAKDDLNETEYDRYISDQEELLDKLYQEYEELINSESKQREILFNRAIQDADNNTNTVIKTNEKYADMLGYKFESNMQNLYSQNGSISNNVASILSTLQNGIVVTTSQSTTPPAATDNAPSSPVSSNTEQLPGIVKEIGNVSFGDSIVAGLDMTRREVENYIDKNGKNPDKGHSYKAVNATLAGKYKKVLSDADLKDLAKKLGIKYDNSKVYPLSRTFRVFPFQISILYFFVV